MAAFSAITAGVGLAASLAKTGMDVANQVDAADDFQQGGESGGGGWASSMGQGGGGFQPTQLQNTPLGQQQPLQQPDEDDGMMPGGAMGFGPWVGGQGGG